MKTSKKKLIVCFFSFISGLMFLALILILWSFNHVSEIEESETIFYETGNSLYNPETVLSDISNGKDEVFIKSDPLLMIAPTDYVNTTAFTDEELFNIAQYYIRTEWGENPDDWRLVEIVYSLYDCKKGFNGPYTMGFIFQKYIYIGEKEYINERSVGIANWLNMIYWYDKIETGNSLSSQVNWEKINYHATDVYHIAEENGGYEIHSQSDNICEYITMILSNNRAWNIDYNTESGSDLIELKINSKNGKVSK